VIRCQREIHFPFDYIWYSSVVATSIQQGT